MGNELSSIGDIISPYIIDDNYKINNELEWTEIIQNFILRYRRIIGLIILIILIAIMRTCNNFNNQNKKQGINQDKNQDKNHKTWVGKGGAVAAAPVAAALASGAGAGGAAAAAPAAATGLTAAAPAAGGFLSGLNLSNLAPLAMSIFGKAPQDLTPEEQAVIARNQETAAAERGVFNERLDAARALLQAGEANPERAFAEAQLGTQRGLRDVERTAAVSGRAGLQDAERRRAAIEGARVGTAAVTGEQARAAQTTAAGLSALPTNVPTTGEELNMKIYEDLYKRRSDYARDLSGAVGQMYGNIA